VSADDMGWRASGADASRARRGSLLVGASAVTVAGAWAATLVATEGEPLLIVPLVGALVGFAVFWRPLFGLYLFFAAVLLFEQFEISGLAPLTVQTHLYENLSGFSSVPLRLSVMDLLVLMIGASWGLRRAVGANAPARAGPLGWALAAYGLAFALGMMFGASRGGDWNEIAALAEMRGAVYVCLVYFLTANLVHERRQLQVLLWEFVILVGVKAFQAIGNYAQVRMNGPYWVETVTAHEEVVFFNVAIALALVMVTLRVRGRLFYFLLALQPVILAAELWTTRRVAFLALGAALLVVILMSAIDRPRATLLAVAVGMLAFGIYAATYWDYQGPIAGPLRVIRGAIDPYSQTARDQGSNRWREIENANIAFTVRQLPLTGVGLGHEYLFQQEPPALTTFPYWRLMTHNAVLWLWLKAGPFGAFALWFLVTQVVFVGLQLYRRLGDPLLRAAASFPVLVTVVLLVFSSVDLGLTQHRTMSVLGVALGLAAPLRAWVGSQRPEIRASRRAVESALRSPDDTSPRRGRTPLGGRVPSANA
jgi:hypothetical protein